MTLVIRRKAWKMFGFRDFNKTSSMLQTYYQGAKLAQTLHPPIHVPITARDLELIRYRYFVGEQISPTFLQLFGL